MKKLIVFDLDGTLAESKLEFDAEMADLLAQPSQGRTSRGHVGGADRGSRIEDHPVRTEANGVSRMIFVGDALFPGGNDYPAKELGVATIHVRDPDETKRVIEAIDASLETAS